MNDECFASLTFSPRIFRPLSLYVSPTKNCGRRRKWTNSEDDKEDRRIIRMRRRQRRRPTSAGFSWETSWERNAQRAKRPDTPTLSFVWSRTTAPVSLNKKARLTQRERATAVHVWRPTANKCKIRKNLYFSAQGHSRSLLSVSIETRVWLPISD